MIAIAKADSDTYILTDEEKEVLKEAQNIIAQLISDTGYLTLYRLSTYDYGISFLDLIDILHEIIDNSNKEFKFEED